jgi:peptide-methionine (R)-S-oxide reductase
MSDLKQRLGAECYHVTQEKGTEAPFTGKYYKHSETGVYHCVCCEAPLFTSTTKYESGSGWPSFWQPVNEQAVTTHTDTTLGMVRTEITCTACGAHLGHVFDDGPQPTGQRYCVNSLSLDFKSE